MEQFKEFVDFNQIEDDLYRKKFSPCCRFDCWMTNCCRSCCKWLRDCQFTKGRLRLMSSREKVSLFGGLMFIVVQSKDAFDFITDAYLALRVYQIGRNLDRAAEDETDLTKKQKLVDDVFRHTLLFASIFFSIASPYFIYYSSYMKLILFNG